MLLLVVTPRASIKCFYKARFKNSEYRQNDIDINIFNSKLVVRLIAKTRQATVQLIVVFTQIGRYND